MPRYRGGVCEKDPPHSNRGTPIFFSLGVILAYSITSYPFHFGCASSFQYDPPASSILNNTGTPSPGDKVSTCINYALGLYSMTNKGHLRCFPTILAPASDYYYFTSLEWSDNLASFFEPFVNYTNVYNSYSKDKNYGHLSYNLFVHDNHDGLYFSLLPMLKEDMTGISSFAPIEASSICFSSKVVNYKNYYVILSYVGPICHLHYKFTCEDVNNKFISATLPIAYRPIFDFPINLKRRQISGVTDAHTVSLFSPGTLEVKYEFSGVIDNQFSGDYFYISDFSSGYFSALYGDLKSDKVVPLDKGLLLHLFRYSSIVLAIVVSYDVALFNTSSELMLSTIPFGYRPAYNSLGYALNYNKKYESDIKIPLYFLSDSTVILNKASSHVRYVDNCYGLWYTDDPYD